MTAVEQAEGLQEADRGGRGDSRLEPGKVQENSGKKEKEVEMEVIQGFESSSYVSRHV